MTLEFLTGFALLIVAVASLVFIVAGVMGFGVGDLKGVRLNFSKRLDGVALREAKPVNQHLCGAVGQVVAHSGNDARPMRVRLNLEYWPARASSTASDLIAVGNKVKVIEVDGAVLVVEAVEPESEPLEGGTGNGSPG